MNAITKLTAMALGALTILGGAAVAQSTSKPDANANPDTANYGTPPGAALKRDGSLSTRNGATTTNSSATADTSSTSTRSSVATANGAHSSLQPRADRN
jgi:hypothetical protein